MAQYKVIQDIEAEDKLLGPLTLKGFIYAIIAVFCAFINFRLITSGIGPFKYLLILMFLLPMILFGVLASPLGRHQPTEVWLLARLRFLIKPKKRIWSQSGIQHLVKITAPKKFAKQRTKGLSETEVKSRLQTLASTLDSRGWAVKNVTVAPDKLEEDTQSDRLVAPTTLSAIDLGIEVHPADDILDEANNPTAQYFSGLMQQADADRKINTASRLPAARQAVAKAEKDTKNPIEHHHRKFLVPSEKTGKKTKSDSVTPQPKLDAPQSDYRSLSSSFDYTQDTLSPVERAGFGAGQAAADEMTEADRADKLELAQSGNDFSVATLSKLANRKGQFTQLGPNEGVLQLH